MPWGVVSFYSIALSGPIHKAIDELILAAIKSGRSERKRSELEQKEGVKKHCSFTRFVHEHFARESSFSGSKVTLLGAHLVPAVVAVQVDGSEGAVGALPALEVARQ